MSPRNLPKNNKAEILYLSVNALNPATRAYTHGYRFNVLWTGISVKVLVWPSYHRVARTMAQGGLMRRDG